MSDKCHAVLKDYANAWDMTMSEVLYEAARCLIHKSSEECPFVQSMFKYRQINQDKRLTKTAMDIVALPVSTPQPAALAFMKVPLTFPINVLHYLLVRHVKFNLNKN